MTQPGNPDPIRPPIGGKASLYLGIFLVSLAVLGMEILQTRLFSLMLWHHITYFVVTITLLGFAASGSAMAIFPGLYRGDLRAKAGIYALLFSLTSIAALWLLAYLRPETLGNKEGTVEVLDLFFSYFYLIVPYVFAGLSIGVLLKGLAQDVGPLYAVNLAGSGAGCFLFVLAITPFGGAGTTLFITFVGGLGALALTWGGGCAIARRTSIVVTSILGIGTILAIFMPNLVLPIPVAGSKLMEKELALTGKKVEKTIWGPLCRIDVVPVNDTKGKEEKRVYQDGDAPTTIWSGELATAKGKEGFYEYFFYSLAYLTRRTENPDVLIIGPGGGVDVENALHFGAREISAVEINPVTLKMVREDYKEFTATGRKHGVYDFPTVNPINSEGRAWMRRSDKKFDLIQMTGTDTYAALASGAYVFSESYLYTKEAFTEYLDHLKDDGRVTILRFRFEPARETLKLASIAAEALKEQGAKDPSRHIIVINITQDLPQKYQDVFGIEKMRYAVTMTKRTPWTEGQVKKYHDWVARSQQPAAKAALSFYATVGYTPTAGKLPERCDSPHGEYKKFFAAIRDDRLADFLEEYPYDVGAITDNSPFFFKFHKWSEVLFGEKKDEKIDYGALAGREPIGLRILLSLLLFVTIAVLVLVLLPLIFLKRQGATTQKTRIFIYFFGIGLGFIFAEVASLQRFVLFLGHPTYSLTVVLFSFLLFMGVGSLVTNRLRLTSNLPTRLALGGILVVILLQNIFLADLFQSCLHFSEGGRMAIAAACIAPLAFLMGFAFPTGLRLTDRLSPSLVPWAWGVNGAASVTGSVLAIIFAMAGGFTLVMSLAAICYLAALIMAPRPVAD